MEEEEENVKFLQVLTRFYFLCAATRSIDPYKLALHSFPTFQVFRHSWSFTLVQLLSLATVATCHTRGQQSPVTTRHWAVVTVLHHLDFPEFLQPSTAVNLKMPPLCFFPASAVNWFLLEAEREI